MVDGKEHRHGNDGEEQHQIVQRIIRAARQIQYQRQTKGDEHRWQQIDGDQSAQPLPEQLQNRFRLTIKTIGEHAVIAVHEHSLGDILSAVDKIHD